MWKGAEFVSVGRLEAGCGGKKSRCASLALKLVECGFATERLAGVSQLFSRGSIAYRDLLWA